MELIKAAELRGATACMKTLGTAIARVDIWNHDLVSLPPSMCSQLNKDGKQIELATCQSLAILAKHSIVGL